MTRLISEQVLKIPATLANYDRQLKKIIGWTLKELALAAVTTEPTSSPDFDPEAAVCISGHGTVGNKINSAPPNGPGTVKDAQLNNPAADYSVIANHPVAVIPVTSGQGTIEGFTEALSAIACHLGFPAFITTATDIAGLAEAYQGSATIALMADDHYFAAFNLLTRCVAGNDQATARGYTAALKKMSGSLAGKEVLLIGLGPLGIAVAQALLQEGAGLILFDLARAKETALLKSFTTQEQQRITTTLTLEQALNRTHLIFDASPGEAFIPAVLLRPDACIAAPGLPLGLDTAAANHFADRLIHDPLQIGTAVMLFQALVLSRGDDDLISLPGL